jgi:excisionase family DNA binding protein
MPGTIESAPLSGALVTARSEALEPLLSKADAARLLGASIRTLESWLASGLLPATRICGLVKVDPRDLREFIARAKTRQSKEGTDNGRNAH